jgi:hypothetical protein
MGSTSPLLLAALGRIAGVLVDGANVSDRRSAVATVGRSQHVCMRQGPIILGATCYGLTVQYAHPPYSRWRDRVSVPRDQRAPRHVHDGHNCLRKCCAI